MHFVLTKAIVSPNNVKLYCRGEIFSESDYKDLQRNLGLDHIEALVCPDASAAATLHSTARNCYEYNSCIEQ